MPRNADGGDHWLIQFRNSVHRVVTWLFEVRVQILIEENEAGESRLIPEPVLGKSGRAVRMGIDAASPLPTTPLYCHGC